MQKIYSLDRDRQTTQFLEQTAPTAAAGTAATATTTRDFWFMGRPSPTTSRQWTTFQFQLEQRAAASEPEG